MTARYPRIPFAQSGDKTAIPDATTTDGSVSYTTGYPLNYDLPASDVDAQFLNRGRFNQLLNTIDCNIQQYWQQGTPPFITTADNGGTAFAYPQFARVVFNDRIYSSNVANNTTDPANTTNWTIDDPQRFTRLQTFTTAGISTWTVPDGVRFARVIVISGGGGAGRDDTRAGGGGGGGGYTEGIVSLIGITSVTVTVGSGGAGRSGSEGIGSSGGASSFGTFISAVGGSAGSLWSGGRGGIGSGGLINTSTGPGHPSTRVDIPSFIYAPGAGGGTAGAESPRNAGTAGITATLPGGGGSGGWIGQDGGSGAAGAVGVIY